MIGNRRDRRFVPVDRVRREDRSVRECSMHCYCRVARSRAGPTAYVTSCRPTTPSPFTSIPCASIASDLEKELRSACGHLTDHRGCRSRRRWRFRSTYGGESGPDLAAVAGFGGCSEQDVVRAAHPAAIYRVYMLGFLPGFAYMGSVDPRIAMPRLTTPRMRVPAGSVGIAGMQTGIYPCETPGGWRIIGRTADKSVRSGASRIRFC